MIYFLFQAAFKAAKDTKDGRDQEISALRLELEVHVLSFLLILNIVNQFKFGNYAVSTSVLCGWLFLSGVVC